MGVNSLPKTVTRQHRSFDLNPGILCLSQACTATEPPSFYLCIRVIVIIINKDIYIAQVRKGQKCAVAEMAVWLRNCQCLYSYLHNYCQDNYTEMSLGVH